MPGERQRAIELCPCSASQRPYTRRCYRALRALRLRQAMKSGCHSEAPLRLYAIRCCRQKAAAAIRRQPQRKALPALLRQLASYSMKRVAVTMPGHH